MRACSRALVGVRACVRAYVRARARARGSSFAHLDHVEQRGKEEDHAQQKVERHEQCLEGELKGAPEHACPLIVPCELQEAHELEHIQPALLGLPSSFDAQLDERDHEGRDC